MARKPDTTVVSDEEKREQVSKLVWIGITVLGTIIMGIFMLRAELHALISENEPLPPSTSAPATPGVPPPAAPTQGQPPAGP
ncbi:hypothetical protein [Komagataeibacter swingsii]|uniref:Uncharacterized protein n=1 Tax=Komagataeibacter swingsii TaxID=215220 RepID=A0A2V4RL03_9PROT|nr:hypothetical protein [Komagataeibacter swingsii]PYD70446.1 hypothetical protein CFR76_03485 [Komagataeibacter swingsii]GBQ59477.1 hypothetical protein AA16373_1591 [Komagataeibacter swingsii DSM 16373]